jgi:hypothetical protein
MTVAMSSRATPYLRVLLIGGVLFVAGIALDQRWHATHDEFEGASQQLEAHWLLWLGALTILVVVVLAFTRLSASERNAGYTVTLAGLLLYVPVSVWHFVAHANEVDPEVAHLLLATGDVAIITGIALAALLARRGGSAQAATR